MKVGDYIRIKYQGINKIDDYYEDLKKFSLQKMIRDDYGEMTDILDENDVIKSSPNIIDLIEAGDYVNGYKVNGFVFSKGKKIGVSCDCDFIGYDADEIKSILTKEQFESMEYKIC